MEPEPLLDELAAVLADTLNEEDTEAKDDGVKLSEDDPEPVKLPDTEPEEETDTVPVMDAEADTDAARTFSTKPMITKVTSSKFILDNIFAAIC
jgi:hypothetical protein